MRSLIPLGLSLLACGATTLFSQQVQRPPAGATRTNPDYRIGPRDEIQFQVHAQPDTVTRQRVSATGELRLPFVGSVKVGGQTVREAEKTVEQRLRDGGFFVAPQAIISVEQFRERYVSLLGEVKNPDRVEFPSETSTLGILQAVAQVGGFTRVARTDAVQVFRTRPDGVPERFTLNLDEFLRPKTAAQGMPEFQLAPGDVVFVAERKF